MESRDAGDLPVDDMDRAAADAVVRACNALGFGVVQVALAGRIISADDLVCAVTGRTREDLLSLADLSVCYAPEERHRVVERRRQRASGAAVPTPHSSVLIRPDGTRVPIEWAATEIDQGTPDHRLVVVLRDNTTLAGSQIAVARYERLLEHTPIAVLVWDAAGVDQPSDMRLLSANHAAVAALSALAGGRIGERLGDIFPDQRDDAARTFALRGSGSVEHFQDHVVGDPERPDSVYRRRAIDLSGGAIAFVMEDVTRERVESLRRRRLLERLVDGGDDERRAIAMAVHDEPVQQLAAATLLLEALRRHPESSDRDLRLEAIEASLRATMTGLRRLVFELSPPELVDSGLRGALDSALDHLFRDTDVVVSLHVDVPDEPVSEIQTAAFRIAAEALANVRKHAEATHVCVDLHTADGMLHIEVSDDGSGFVTPMPAARAGLRTMRERARSVGGSCAVTSGPDGTRVDAVLPLGGRHTGAHATFDADLAVPAIDAEVESLRRERDSLVAAAHRHRATIAELGRQLDHTLALWAVLDDTTLSVEVLLARASRQVAELCKDGCGVLLLSPDGDAWELVICHHPDAEQREFLEQLMVAHPPTEMSHPAVALRSNAAVLLDHRASPWDGSGRVLPKPPVKPNSAIIAPIRVRGEPRGVLTVVRDITETRFAERDVDMVQRVADRLGAALARCTPANPG